MLYHHKTLKKMISFWWAPIATVLVLALIPTAKAETSDTTQTAIFAGGCFWCVESDFDKVQGVIKTV